MAATEEIKDSTYLRGWRYEATRSCKKEDDKLKISFTKDEGIYVTNSTLYANIPEDVIEQTLDTPILDFEDMMSRMQRALINQANQVKQTDSKSEILKQEFEKEGYCKSMIDNQINHGIDKALRTPILLDVKRTTELFRRGQLDTYVAESEAVANNLQRKLILALEGPSAGIEYDEEESYGMTRCEPSSASRKRLTLEESNPNALIKKPNIPHLHPLNTNGRKPIQHLSARAQVIPSPVTQATAFSSPSSDTSPNRVPVPGLISQQNNRKVAFAVRKNPTNSNISRVRMHPQVPQRVTVRPVAHQDSSPGPRVVSIESLQKSPSKIPSVGQSPNRGVTKPVMIHQGMIMSPAVNLPSAITIFPTPPDQQGVLYPNKTISHPVITTKLITTTPEEAVPAYRPASARKSPHRSTMYSTNPVPIQPKLSDLQQKKLSLSPLSQSYVPIQPRLSVGQAQDHSGFNNEPMDMDANDEIMPQIMSIEGGVTTFISKLNSIAKEQAAMKHSEKPKQLEKVTISAKSSKVTDGCWLLGCQTCGTTYPLSCDNKYRQHLMVEHSIEVDDKEIQSTKFYAQKMYKCKKCEAAFFKNREDHHKTCNPNVNIDEAFQEVPFSANPTETIKCGICSNVFDTRINLRQHLEERHLEVVNSTLLDPKYRCSRCLRAFIDSGTLTGHVKNCKATLSSKDSILEIARSLLKCDVCSKTHSKISEVQICYASKKLIRCMLCLYTCISRQNFSKHMLHFHRRNNIGIACPFCPSSEIAAVRAQFEHIVSSHYNTAIDEDDKKTSFVPPAPPPTVSPSVMANKTPMTTVIRLPAGQTAAQYLQQANLMNASNRPIYRKDAAGNIVLAPNQGPVSFRPVLNTIRSPGNVRYIVGPSRSQTPTGNIRPNRPQLANTGIPGGAQSTVTSGNFVRIQPSTANTTNATGTGNPVRTQPANNTTGTVPTRIQPANKVVTTATGATAVRLQLQPANTSPKPVVVTPTVGTPPIRIQVPNNNPITNTSGTPPIRLISVNKNTVTTPAAGPQQIRIQSPNINVTTASNLVRIQNATLTTSGTPARILPANSPTTGTAIRSNLNTPTGIAARMPVATYSNTPTVRTQMVNPTAGIPPIRIVSGSISTTAGNIIKIGPANRITSAGNNTAKVQPATAGNIVKVLPANVTTTAGNIVKVLPANVTTTAANIVKVVPANATTTAGNNVKVVPAIATTTAGNIVKVVPANATTTAGNIVKEPPASITTVAGNIVKIVPANVNTTTGNQIIRLNPVSANPLIRPRPSNNDAPTGTPVRFSTPGTVVRPQPVISSSIATDTPTSPSTPTIVSTTLTVSSTNFKTPVNAKVVTTTAGSGENIKATNSVTSTTTTPISKTVSSTSSTVTPISKSASTVSTSSTTTPISSTGIPATPAGTEIEENLNSSDESDIFITP